MKHALVLAAAILVGGTVRAEDETVAVKIYVKGMSCPDACGAAVAKSLEKVEGAKAVKLTDFESGLFTVSMDPKIALKPASIQKSVGKGYDVTKVEATLAGTVTLEKDTVVLKTASGTKYVVATGLEKKCAADAKQEEKDAAAKSNEDVKVASANLAKIKGWIAEKKGAVKVTGVVAESCCDDELSITAKLAELSEAKLN